MRIKNIQQFRTVWRNQEGYKMTDWDENFIGSVHNAKLFGFYRMVNGIVDNIKADLTPKLQNAQDEQAIYEFLQNAADSHSTECAVIYDEDYFMVLNNGKPFTEKDLKALLNSFQGTKADKSKPENCGKIGRYGIGFKLAYRLMGKSDGADELLNNMAGPLLFSWHNKDQFEGLLNYNNSPIVADDLNTDGADTPWLLKIILACFPTGLGETVKDLDYDAKVLFQQEELTELVQFMQKHKTNIENLLMPQGSLFFLKFGPKKHEKLKESLLNIQSGIGYSMNTLKTLEKVVLQDVSVEKYDTEFERYNILPGTEEFLRIDPEFPFCPIEIALGFPKDMERMKALKRAPSIYQFFPMRNERHSMAYFVHSTSFSKITDRTRLDDQGESNIETFIHISKALKKNLAKYKHENFEQFVLIYRALLLSDQSEEYDADLINNHLYFPLLEIIRNSIPTHKRNFYLKDLVVVKNTRLDVDPMSLGIGKEWFYWNDLDKDDDLMREATNNAKLGLRRWGIKELILEGTPALVDNWIENLSTDAYNLFVSELKSVEFDADFMAVFQHVKCFRFSDIKGNVSFLSINDLHAQENIFLMSERTLSIREEVKALGFAVLEFNILDYSVILRQLEQKLDYLSNDRALYFKIADKTVHASLSALQKHNLFAFLSQLDGVREDELRKLALFSNEYGQVVPLQSLLALDAEVDPWLMGFRINKEEDAELLRAYYAQTGSWELYANVIAPYWNDLVKHSLLKGEDHIVQLYEQAVQYYNLKSGMPKLTDAKMVFVHSADGFALAQDVFYYKTLAESTDYPSLRSAVLKTMDLLLPHPAVLEYMSMDPFRILATPASKEWRNLQTLILERSPEASLSAAEKKALFALLKTILQPKDLLKLELFCNNAGQPTVLNSMIASTEVLEPWFKVFQINKEEDDEMLQGYLASDAEIFNQVIQPNWEELIAQPVVAKNIEAFYRSVEKYALLAKSTKPLSSLPYVFVSEEVGFVSSSELIYHPSMLGQDYYKDLRSALWQLTGMHTAHPEVLPFLSQNPFKTREVQFGRLIRSEDVLMTKEEASALIRYMDFTKEEFFQYLTAAEGDNSREVVLSKKGRNTAFYLEKSQLKLAEKIREAFGDTYVLLPQKLYFPELRNKGLLQGAELFNALSKSRDASPELLSALIVESSNSEVQQLVFGKIDKIVLKHGKIYDKDSFEHQSLQVFRNKEADHSKLREKIFIEDAEGVLHKLTEIAFEENISFAIDRVGKFSLPLAKVLPKYAYFQTLLDEILERMVDYEAPTVLKRKCFEAEEKPARRVFAELRQEFPVLENAAQLAFLLLMTKQEDSAKLLQGFSVYSLDGEAVSLTEMEAYHLNTNIFINPKAVLSGQHYDGVDLLLNMEANNNRKASFEFGAQRLVFEPFFDRNLFFCAPLRPVIEDESLESLQEDILNFCYQKWKKEENLPQEIEFYSGEKSVFSDLNWDSMVFPSNYALLKEELPAWVVKWLGNDAKSFGFDDKADYSEDDKPRITGSDKLSFITALGVNTHRSNLVRLRRYFHDKLGVIASQKQLNDIYSSYKPHLLNTILWLQSEGTKFSSNDDRIHWLRKLYNTLELITPNTPLPYIQGVKGADEEFVYVIDSQTEGELYYFDSKQQQQLFERYELRMAHVHKCLEKASARMTNLTFKTLELPTSQIEELLEIEKIKTESREWAAPHYLRWREEAPFRIYLFEGKIPYSVRFLGQIVKEMRQGDAVVHERAAFVNGQVSNIEENLFEVASRNSLSELMLLQLLRYKNESETGNVQQHATIERIVERVVVPEEMGDHEELIENPAIEALQELREQKAKGKLKMAFDLSELPEELLIQLMTYSKSTRMIVEKKSINKE